LCCTSWQLNRPSAPGISKGATLVLRLYLFQIRRFQNGSIHALSSWVPQFRGGIIDPIIPDKDGMLYPFTKPGPGFEIRKDWLCKYGKRFFMNAPLCQNKKGWLRKATPAGA
jgi:hypothetical protein